MIDLSTKKVDVIMNHDKNGLLVPYVIEKDGKIYGIQDVKQIRVSSGRQGIVKEKYLVNINGHDKFVFREGYHWYIYDEAEDERTFANPASSPAEAVAI